jgi:hypothetical protein
MFAGLRSLIMAIRKPAPGQRLPMPRFDSGHSSITLALGRTPQSAVEHLVSATGLPVGQPVLVVPSVATKPGQGAHPQVVATLLAHLGHEATLGVPHGTAMPLRRRWERMAHNAGCQSVRLGDAGWDAIDLDDDAFLLDQVLVPAEFTDFERRLFVPALRDEALALGFLRTIVHPHSRLRARSSANRARLDVEVARAANGSFLLDATRLPGLLATNLLVWADDPLSTELVALGIQRFIDVAQGLESISVWEHHRVQAATELGIGPATGNDIVLNVRKSDAGMHALVEFLATELGCSVCWMAEEGIDES